MEYNFRDIEQKWQKRWVEMKTYRVTEDPTKKKFYVLNMFPYPSGAGLHVGHPLGYIASDIYARYKRLQGYNVLNPMGYDAYGLPAEQYAIQTGQHPEKTTVENINRYRSQLDKIGFSFDWEREVRTCDPIYYKWTQWAFQRMFKSYYSLSSHKAQPTIKLIEHFELMGTENCGALGTEELHFTASDWASFSEKKKQEVLMNYRIAYLAETMVNWCPALGTVLANDEVVNGVSERGGYPVEQKKMRQWCLRVSAYAQRLLDGLDEIDWSDSLKEAQRNWIGRSEGTEMEFKVADSDKSFTIFTTRADTIFGVTFMVLAPESELVDQLTTPEQRQAVDEYLAYVKKRTERERQTDHSVTGVFSGSYAINPFTGEKIPIWIAEYVLAGYGTGAIMAVPAHDTRDWDFAKKYGIPIIEVVSGGDPQREAWTGDGPLVNSSNDEISLDGLGVDAAKARITDWLTARGQGTKKVNYKLRDWLFSRQRYWGEPFPLVHCPHCGVVPVPEDQLPVRLPAMEDYRPTHDGRPPLARAEEWVKTTCPVCGAPAQRETNTMPQWAGSCWYYLRYIDPANDTVFVDPALEKAWMPVDLYVGGAEHAVLHLLYARFWHKVLFDIGAVSTPEPFQRLVNQGMILGEMEYTLFRDPEGQPLSYGTPAWETCADRTAEKLPETDVVKQGDRFVWKADPSIAVRAKADKMSKSRGNVINPDDVVKAYGADSLRLYEMFMGPLTQVKPWSTKGVEGVHRFLNRVYRLVLDGETGEPNPRLSATAAPTPAQSRALHACIKKVTTGIEKMEYNTAISAMMILVNEAQAWETIPASVLSDFILLLSPFAPHIAEELWQKLGHNETLAYAPWPTWDETHLTEAEIELPVQVNGKVRGRIRVPADADQDAVASAAEACDAVKPYLDGKTIRKRVVIPRRMVNLVVG